MSTTLYDESLTASDRCDRCGAQAYLRVKFESGGELLFCDHHAKAHSDKLKQVALKIHDETGKIVLPARPKTTVRPLPPRGTGAAAFSACPGRHY